MCNIKYVKLNRSNFNVESLDGFKRYQQVKNCWRFIEGKYTLKPVVYTEDWNLSELRQLAQRIIDATDCGSLAYGATVNGEVVGFALIEKELFGSKNQYADLAEFYVSAPFRRRGIGKKLFDLAAQAARDLGANRLYVSAHSAKESIAAYEKYGCVPAKEINERLAEKEPFDVQMEHELK